ncbi:MAG: ethanolamine utilization protein EutJ [Desulfobacteraceae bacterium]|nr:ethanolamine utilization protein EutJ [Desulfobacteraceae bacterium]
MNPNLEELLGLTDAVMEREGDGRSTGASLEPAAAGHRGPFHVGVDLGTAYTVLIVLDRDYRPIAGSCRFAQIVRDGLVVDFAGAVDLLRNMKQRMEERLGTELTAAASGYPPGVAREDVRAVENVLYAAGLECTGLIDEPTAANNVLQIRDGAIVDVGGGTTGVAVFADGRVAHLADEPTGGTQFTLVIAGAENITFEEAEALIKDPAQQRRLFPSVRPVMEKVGSIVARHIAGHDVQWLSLVGGTCAYPGMGRVIENCTGVKTFIPGNPLFVTPLGIAMHNQ